MTGCCGWLTLLTALALALLPLVLLSIDAADVTLSGAVGTPLAAPFRARRCFSISWLTMASTVSAVCKFNADNYIQPELAHRRGLMPISRIITTATIIQKGRERNWLETNRISYLTEQNQLKLKVKSNQSPDGIDLVYTYRYFQLVVEVRLVLTENWNFKYQ